MGDPGKDNEEQSSEDLQVSHTPEAIKRRLSAGHRHSYLKDFIYGAIDGTITTFAVVSGVAGASLEGKIVLILGLANLLADGFSMAISNFLGTKAEEQYLQKARRVEKKHICAVPDGEREEIRQIFAAKGFKGKALETVVKVITSDPKRWVDTMLQDELGLSLNSPSAVKAALATFVSFFIVGSIPLMAYILKIFYPSSVYNPFIYSGAMTCCAFFIVGAVKSRFVDQKWYWSGLETLIIGGTAAGLAYLVGFALKGLGA